MGGAAAPGAAFDGAPFDGAPFDGADLDGRFAATAGPGGGVVGTGIGRLAAALEATIDGRFLA